MNKEQKKKEVERISDAVSQRFYENLFYTNLNETEKNFLEELSRWAVIYTIDIYDSFIKKEIVDTLDKIKENFS